MRPTRGFTLIEVLVVLFIISIVTTVGLLSVSRNENKQMETFANELAQTLTLAEEKAMLQPVVLGLSMRDASLQFSSYQADEANKKNKWVPVQDSALGKRAIPSNIQLGMEVGGARVNNTSDTEAKLPQIVISTNGDITPFTIYIGKKGEKPRYAVIGDADGNVTSKFLS